jgi:hypothetical protein
MSLFALTTARAREMLILIDGKEKLGGKAYSAANWGKEVVFSSGTH